MKLFTAITLCLSAVLGFSCCDRKATAATESVNTGSGKTLVAYFSASGNTKAVAETAAKALGADLFEIAPQQPYTVADLDYKDETSRSSVEMRDPASRPAMKAKVENMGQYDTVLIGYPIWWGEAPHIVYTFVENNDLSGKKVLPFCTSGSSSPGGSSGNLSKGAAPSARWTKCERFAPSASAGDILQWVNEAH